MSTDFAGARGIVRIEINPLYQTDAMQVTEDKPYDEINITPMLDLAYVLLVIFILMTTATVQGLKASLPRATNAPPKPKKQEEQKLKSISLDAQGRVFLDNRSVSLQDLETLLKAHKV